MVSYMQIGVLMKNVELKYNIVNPVSVVKQHQLTKLFIYYAHCKSMHTGLQFSLCFCRCMVCGL